jgi:hypothetical protein
MHSLCDVFDITQYAYNCPSHLLGRNCHAQVIWALLTVLSTDVAAICMPGYSKSVRNVPVSTKNQVYRAYGILSHKPKEYEIDHLISLELGGSNSMKNLWPQSFVTQPLNAKVKDKLENALHELVCSRKLDIKEAQQAIAQNWTEAYVKYIGSLPGGASPVSTNAPTHPSANEPTASSGTTRSHSLSGANAAPAADGSCPANAPVKMSKAGIYHVVGNPNYARTHAKHCFATVEKATAAGYRAPKN